MDATLITWLTRVECKLDSILERYANNNFELRQTMPVVNDEDDDEGLPPGCPIVEIPTLQGCMQPQLPQSAAELARKSREAYERGDAAVALDLARRAVTLNPDSVSALRARGKAHAAQENWSYARTDLSDAQKIDFDDEIETILKSVCQQCTTAERSTEKKPTFNFEQMMSDPKIMDSVSELLKNPDTMRSIQEMSMFKHMMSGGDVPQFGESGSTR